MTPDIDRLIALCEKAATAKVVELQPAGRMLRYEVDADFANFLRTATPQTILALCAENKRLALRGEGEPVVTIRKTPIVDRAYGINYLPRDWANKLPVGDTPLYAHTTSAAAEGAVTDAMLRAAREAWLSMDVPAEIEVNPANDDMVFDAHLRAALRAALAAAPIIPK